MKIVQPGASGLLLCQTKDVNRVNCVFPFICLFLSLPRFLHFESNSISSKSITNVAYFPRTNLNCQRI